MGRENTLHEQRETLAWARDYRGSASTLDADFTLSCVKNAYSKELRHYFALCGLSRSKTAPTALVDEAWDTVFRVRVFLEKSIEKTIVAEIAPDKENLALLFTGSFFGKSKKQGVSIRFPLSSCNPTSLCGAACYAHDVLDAGPESMVRGAINGVIASSYENGTESERSSVLNHLRSTTKSAVRAAEREAENLEGRWRRRARIRFSHVGEIAKWPLFANALAEMVFQESHGEVDCVVYTRHHQAGALDPSLFVINFTLDKDSDDRKNWAPIGSRIVFSAFDGDLSPDAEVNFLEHHRWSHAQPRGIGHICPATRPDVSHRTCDSAHCDICFNSPVIVQLDHS